jgi:hypothetical protein
MSTTGVGLLFCPHIFARVPSCGISDHHTARVRRPVGLWFRPNTGESRGGRKGEGQGHSRECTPGPSACARVQCMVLGGSCLLYLKQHTPSPTHTDELTQAVPQGRGSTHNNDKQAEKQAGWRKSGRWKGSKRRRKVKSDRQGVRGELKQILGFEKNENDWWEGKKEQKDLITYVDKPTHLVG